MLLSYRDLQRTVSATTTQTTYVKHSSSSMHQLYIVLHVASMAGSYSTLRYVRHLVAYKLLLLLSVLLHEVDYLVYVYEHLLYIATTDTQVTIPL